MFCRDHAGDVGGIGNNDLTGAKSALPRRSEKHPYGKKRKGDLTWLWLIFRKRDFEDVSRRAAFAQSVLRFFLAVNAKRLRGDHAPPRRLSLRSIGRPLILPPHARRPSRCAKCASRSRRHRSEPWCE